MNILSAVSSADVLRSWKATHHRLVDAINAYAIACAALESRFSQARPSFSEDQSDFDSALQSVRDELLVFERHKQTLEKSQSHLNRARNLSHTLVPINRLPQSLLLSIFSHLTEPEYAKRTHLPLSSGRSQSNPALTILSVCASWRNLALETPSFWSTIFFHPENQGNQLAQVSLARAGDAFLDIQAVFPKALDNYNWLPLLQPRYDQIRSLDLVLPNMDLLRTLLAIWPQDSLAPSLKMLSVKVAKTVYRTDVALPKILPYRAHSQFLQNLTSFSLCGGYFDWDSAAFVGLEHLQLVQIVNRGLTLGRIVGMLKASPRLRTLSLAGISMAQEEETDHPPVHLEHLQKLSLMSTGERDLYALVPLLFPGSRPLALHLKNELNSDLLIQLFSKLFRRSNIESIYLHNRITGQTQQTMSDIFSTLPHLRYLYCSHNDMGNVLRVLSAPLSTGNSNAPSLLPCPQLRAVHFSKCGFEATAERPIGPITNQPTLIVKFQNCIISHPEGFSRHELASGTVDFKYEDSFSEPPFDGVDHTRISMFHLDPELLGPNMMGHFLMGLS